MFYVGADVGGQTIKVGVVDDQGSPVCELSIVPTESERGNDHFLNQLCKSIRLSVSEAGLDLKQIKPSASPLCINIAPINVKRRRISTFANCGLNCYI